LVSPLLLMPPARNKNSDRHAACIISVRVRPQNEQAPIQTLSVPTAGFDPNPSFRHAALGKNLAGFSGIKTSHLPNKITQN
jgi:hypothetical protein